MPALAAVALSAAPAAAAAASRPMLDAKVVYSSQRTVVRRRSVKVAASVRRTGLVRLFVTFRPYAKRAPTEVVTRLREVRLRAGSPRRVSLALNRAGMRQMRGCTGGRLVVTAARIASPAGRPGKAVRRSAKLRRDASACRKGGSGGGSGGGGSGGGGGGGGSGGGGSTGGGGSGGGGSQAPIDYAPANADRCDWLDEADCLYPFPNDRFTVADPTTDTKRRLDFNPLSMPRNVEGKPIDPLPYGRVDGFSPGQAMITRVPGLDSPAAFRKTGAVPIDDMADAFRPTQPVVLIDTKTRARHLVWAELDSNPLRSDPPQPEAVTLLIRPGENLVEGRRYVVALRNMRDAPGKVLPANLAFRVYRDGIPTTSDAVEARRPSFESMFRTLAEAGIERDDLYRAWDFTVASERSLSERMLSIRDDAFAKLGDTNLKDMKIQGDAPAFQVTSVESYTPEQNSRLLKAIHGTYTVPCYLNVPECPSGSTFAFDPTKTNGPPTAIPGNTMQARFTCIVPRAAVDKPARSSLYGHGLLGSRGEAFQGQLQNFASEHDVVFCATDWIGMACADLPSDNPEDLDDYAGVLFEQVGRGAAPQPTNCDYGTVVGILHDLSLFPALTDRVQQGMLNFLYLGRLMIHPDGLSSDPELQVGPGGRSAIDTAHGRMYYDGNSQGGIIGGALAAFMVDGDRATLGVPGMNYSTLLTRSVDWGTGKQPEPEADLPEYSWFMYSSYTSQVQRPLVLGLIQILWDRAEANGYAHHMTTDPYPNTPPHEVMLHVGLGDHQVAQIAAEVEARTIGARARFPWAEPGRDLDRGSPIYGVPPIESYPYAGSAIVLWDIGPPRTIGDRLRGTKPPPNENVPPDGSDQDPHELPRRQPAARQQKSAFFAPGGMVIDVCGAGPCLADPTL